MKKGPIKMSGSFQGKSNALGHGGRAAQLKARGVPGGVIGNLARAAGAAPGGPNYHGKKHKAAVPAKTDFGMAFKRKAVKKMKVAQYNFGNPKVYGGEMGKAPAKVGPAPASWGPTPGFKPLPGGAALKLQKKAKMKKAKPMNDNDADDKMKSAKKRKAVKKKSQGSQTAFGC